MSSYDTDLTPDEAAHLAAEGLATATFLRLDPVRRRAILGAVLAEAQNRGPGEINIKELAARAGVPVGSLYQYFPHREALLRAAAWLVSSRLAAQLEAAGPALAALPLAEALGTYLLSGLEWSRQEAGFLRFFAQAVYRDALDSPGPALRRDLVEPIARALLGLVRGILEAARDRGELRPGLDADAASRIVHTVLCASGDAVLLPGLNDYYRLYGPGEDPASRVGAVVDLLVAGLARKEG